MKKEDVINIFQDKIGFLPPNPLSAVNVSIPGSFVGSEGLSDGSSFGLIFSGAACWSTSG